MSQLLQYGLLRRFSQLLSASLRTVITSHPDKIQTLGRFVTVPPPSENTGNSQEQHSNCGEDGIEFNSTNQPSFPKSLQQARDSDRDLTFCQSDNPDEFGSLSKFKSVKTDLYEGDEGDKLEDEYASFPIRLPQKKYAAMIKKYLMQRRFADALNVLEVRMLKEDRVKPEYYIYGMLINFCGKVGYTKMAFHLYSTMKKKQLNVTPSIYTSLFNACANSPYTGDGYKRAIHLRNIMVKSNYVPTAITCHAMIKAFGRSGNLQEAFEVADFMMEKKMALQTETFNFLIQACISDKQTGFRHVLLVLKKMLGYRISPDLYLFNLVLRCVRDSGIGDFTSMIDVLRIIGVDESKLKQLERPNAKTPTLETAGNPWEEDLQVLSEITTGSGRNEFHEEVPNLPITYPVSKVMSNREDSLEFLPNLFNFPPTLGSVVSLSEIRDAQDRLFLLGGSKGFIEEMTKHGVKPDFKTAGLLLDCIPNTCSAEDALIKMFKDLEVRLDISFFNSLIKRRCFRKQYNEAKEVVNILSREGFQVDLLTYGCLAMTCRSELEACELLKSVEESGFRPNIVMLTSMMGNALLRFNYQYMQLIFEVIAFEEMKVNKKFISILDRFYNKAKTSDEDSTVNAKQKETMKKFCIHYPTWKKCAEVEDESVRPWQEFKQKYSTTEEDEGFLTSFVEPAALKGTFPRLTPTTSIKVRALKLKKLKEEQPELFWEKKINKLRKTRGPPTAEGVSLKELAQSKSGVTTL